jgi:anti-sigma B factor antagonist
MPAILDETTTGQWHLSLSGPLTIYEVAEIQGSLKPLKSPESLTIDLQDVDEIDTAGLQLLLALRQWLGEHLHLTRHSQAVIDLIDLFQLAAFFGDDIVLSQH